jgi:hypothetical protein
MTDKKLNQKLKELETGILRGFILTWVIMLLMFTVIIMFIRA